MKAGTTSPAQMVCTNGIAQIVLFCSNCQVVQYPATVFTPALRFVHMHLRSLVNGFLRRQSDVLRMLTV